MFFIIKYSIFSFLLLVTNHVSASSSIPSLVDLAESAIAKQLTPDTDKKCRSMLPTHLYEEVKSYDCDMHGKYVKCRHYGNEYTRCGCVTPDGQYIVTAGLGCIIQVWAIATGALVQTINTQQSPNDSIISVTVTPDSRYIISRSLGCPGTACISDIQTGTLIGLFGNVFAGGVLIYANIMAPLDSITIMPNSNFVVTYKNPYTISISNLRNGDVLNLYPNVMGGYVDPIVTPDSQYIISIMTNGTALIWDWLKSRTAEIWPMTNNKDSISAAAITPNGRFIVVGDNTKMIHIWNFQTKQLVRSFSTLMTYPGKIAVTRDNRFIISCDCDGIYVWDFYTGELKQSIAERLPTYSAITVTSNGNLFSIFSANEGIKLYEKVLQYTNNENTADAVNCQITTNKERSYWCCPIL